MKSKYQSFYISYFYDLIMPMVSDELIFTSTHFSKLHTPNYITDHLAFMVTSSQQI